MIPESMLPHRVDIYHLIAQDQPRAYGLPSNEALVYPDLPDKVSVPCYYYYHNDSNGASLVQGQPAQSQNFSYKMIFLSTADIRINDRVIIHGEKFRLGIPDKKLTSHIEVTAKRVTQ